MTRFAPAPTGYLHLGHVVNALHVWTIARDRGLRVTLRVEDHDAQRSRPEYEAALLDDLDWLGFAPDVFPTDAFRAGRCDGRQSDRARLYAEAAADLQARGLIYGCACSRQDLGDQSRYPGTCRDRGIAAGPGVVWRLRLADDIEMFDDWLLGPQTQHPASQCGDVVIRDRLGNWSYQFVASLDDFLQGMTVVIRGRDLLDSTGRQIAIARLLGRATPASFAHHGLIMKSPTQKLSKSDRDTGIRDLRAAGWPAARVTAEALRACPLQLPAR